MIYKIYECNDSVYGEVKRLTGEQSILLQELFQKENVNRLMTIKKKNEVSQKIHTIMDSQTMIGTIDAEELSEDWKEKLTKSLLNKAEVQQLLMESSCTTEKLYRLLKAAAVKNTSVYIKVQDHE